MVRNLAAQIEVVWPQERPLLAGYALPAAPSVLDLACGTGEATVRMAELWPHAQVLGIDVHEPHLETARRLSAGYGARVSYQLGDAFASELPAASFDLSVCRHMLQAVPEPERVIAEMVRVTRPGGRLHLVIEDYGMMHFHPTPLDADRFWRLGPISFAASTGTDLRVGRKAFTMLRRAGLLDVRIDYLVIDTGRVPREVFARIWEAWRDGYATAIAAHTTLALDEVLAHFDGMIAAIRDPEGYGVWQLPVATGSLPPR
ncbi:MAG TPA: class I SAM-dependent methyltransferase [Planctomycetota bacterium]